MQSGRYLSIVVAFTVTGAAAANGDIVGASLVGSWDGFSGSYGDVWGDGDYAYVGHFGSAGVHIIDISDPTRPFEAVEYDVPFPGSDGSAQDVKVADGLLFIGLEGSDSSAHVVDVRDPTNPIPVVDIIIDDFTAIHNVFYHEGYLYMADSGTPRVAIVDLTDLDPDVLPPGPITSTKWTMTDVGDSFVHDVTVVGNRMYASAWDAGIWIYDIENIETSPPSFLGSGPGNNTHSCWPTTDGAFVVTGEERSGGGITVYRVVESGTTVTLEVTDAFAMPESCTSSVHNQVAIGNRVYNSWYGAGLRVYDVDPVRGTLSLAASYDTPALGSTWGVYPFLGPDRVLLSDIGDGLVIVEIESTIPGDVNGDGVVDFIDLVSMLAAWGRCPAPPAECPADVTGDGTVDFVDLLTLLANWT